MPCQHFNYFFKAMLENLNQKRKYIKKQNLNLNKTNFKIFSFKLLFFFFSKRVYNRTIALSSTDPISQILTIPKSFNGLCKPLKFQPFCSISFTSRSHSRRSSSFVFNASRSNKLTHLLGSSSLIFSVQATATAFDGRSPRSRAKHDDATDNRKPRSSIFSVQSLDV